MGSDVILGRISFNPLANALQLVNVSIINLLLNLFCRNVDGVFQLMRYGMVLLYGTGKHQLGTCADDEDSCMYGKRGYTVLRRIYRNSTAVGC